MAYFASKKLNGVVYELTHLEPFRFKINIDDRDICVRVEFGCHCFTSKREEDHTPDLFYTHREEQRSFNLERYELSKLLPSYIRSLAGTSVYWSNKGSFFFWRTPENITYVVFFTALKAKKPGVDVLLKVQSAYPKDALAKFASPIEFAKLMRIKANDEILEFGPKVALKRK